MGEFEQDNLPPAHEAMLRSYLCDQLDPQVGRAEARFRQFLADGSTTPVLFEHRDRWTTLRLPQGFGGWTMGVVGAALAASLAALWAGPSLHQVAPPGPSISRPDAGAAVVNNPSVVQQDVQSQTFDDGTLMLDRETPVRVIRRHDVERMRWFDQNQHLQGEQVVPEDHVVYIQMKTY